MKTSTIIWIVVIFLLIISGGWYLYYSTPTSVTPGGETQATNNVQNDASAPDTNTGTPMFVTVKLTSAGFSPATVTIAQGGTVTWVDENGSPMWVASAIHPIHEFYDGTSIGEHCAAGYAGPTPFDQCSSGENYSFTFNNVGTWKYHNHVNASQFATVIVR